MVLALAVTTRFPEDGSDTPTPSIVTRAAASDALQAIVTGSFAHALVREAVMLSDGGEHLRTPPLEAARLFPVCGGAFG